MGHKICVTGSTMPIHAMRNLPVSTARPADFTEELVTIIDEDDGLINLTQQQVHAVEAVDAFPAPSCAR